LRLWLILRANRERCVLLSHSRPGLWVLNHIELRYKGKVG